MNKIEKIIILNVLILILLISGCESTTHLSSFTSTTGIITKTNTMVTTKTSTQESNFIYDTIDLFLDNLNALDSYQIKVESIVTCKKGIIKYTQNTYETTVKKEDIFYTRTNSSSLFFKIDTLTTYTKEKITVKDENKEEIFTIDEYKEKRGYTPFDRLIQGFVVNENTITNPEYKVNQDKTITISFNLDLIESSSLVSKQMKDYSNMKELPKFTSIYTSLFLTEDLLPIEINTIMDFTSSVSVINDGSFHQELKYSYSLINGEVSIPTF